MRTSTSAMASMFAAGRSRVTLQQRPDARLSDQIMRQKVIKRRQGMRRIAQHFNGDPTSSKPE